MVLARVLSHSEGVPSPRARVTVPPRPVSGIGPDNRGTTAPTPHRMSRRSGVAAVAENVTAHDLRVVEHDREAVVARRREVAEVEQARTADPSRPRTRAAHALRETSVKATSASRRARQRTRCTRAEHRIHARPCLRLLRRGGTPRHWLWVRGAQSHRHTCPCSTSISLIRSSLRAGSGHAACSCCRLPCGEERWPPPEPRRA